jgi:thioredoxin-related protein
VKIIKIAAMLIVMLTLPQVLHCGTNGMQEEINRAKAENKEILVFFFSKYCSYCTKMERDVLKSNEISKILQRDIVYLGVDVEKNSDTAIKFGIRGYPTTVLLNDKGELLARIVGYIKKDDFKVILRFLVGKHYKKTDLMSYIKNDRNR